MSNGDHFGSTGDPLLPRELKERRLLSEYQNRIKCAVEELRRALRCLYLEAPAPVVKDVEKKAEIVINLLEKKNENNHFDI